jgi:hypothetical protein
MRRGLKEAVEVKNALAQLGCDKDDSLLEKRGERRRKEYMQKK